MTARSNAQSTSATAPGTSLRPRNRRLISGLDDDDENSSTLNGFASARLGSPFPAGSRPISPIPAPHLPRPSSRGSLHSNTAGRDGKYAGLGDGSSPRATKPSSGLSSSIWGNSWATLQGIAFDFLGDDNNSQRKRLEMQRSRSGLKVGSATHARSVSTTGHWGPAASSYVPSAGDIGTGTREEQLAAVRAQKRHDMLTRQESSYADTLGRFKRRLSDDLAADSVVTTDAETNALVYVHHVKKDDTLAGLSIRYHCSIADVRKANRMWPNDTVQMRERVLLPVDACGVKGRVLNSLQDLDILGSESEALSAGQAQEVPRFQHSSLSVAERFDEPNGRGLAPQAPPSISTSSADGDGTWEHDAWVLLPNCTVPTQIVRVSRKAIAYFPPARRKSNPYTDAETPSSSLELIRGSTNGTSGRPPVSPLRHDLARRAGRRPRASSNADNGYFPAYLTGPGGVGTMGKDVKMPGPGPDSLNQMFARHLPDVALPRSQQALLTPELPLYSDDAPASDIDRARSSTRRNINLENVGGAIESWMRRVAAKTHDTLQSNGRQKPARASVGAPSKGVDGVGDLIEMTDDFEIGDENEHNRREDTSMHELHPLPSATTPETQVSSVSFLRNTSARPRLNQSTRDKTT